LILLDTHVLLWLDSADPRLGAKAKEAIDEAYRADALAVAAISFWETAMLIEKGRITLDIPVHLWRQDLLSAGLREIAVDGEIGITAATLESFHGDSGLGRCRAAAGCPAITTQQPAPPATGAVGYSGRSDRQRCGGAVRGGRLRGAAQ
jgi:PIN domain nuclease of toxin-antitoxin system